MTTRNKILSALFLLLLSCKDEGKTSSGVIEDSIVTTTKTVIADTLSSGCYSQIIQRDTSYLQVEKKGNNVTGSLSYNIYGKDRNDGTFQGDVSGDVLIGWYLFRSEGIVSVRQVAWKIKGNELWPGSGEGVLRNDTMQFVQPDKLQYDSVRRFKKVPCVL